MSKRRYSRKPGNVNAKGKQSALGVTRGYRTGDILTHKIRGERVRITKIDRNSNVPYTCVWIDTAWNGISACTYTFLKRNFK